MNDRDGQELKSKLFRINIEIVIVEYVPRSIGLWCLGSVDNVVARIVSLFSLIYDKSLEVG